MSVPRALELPGAPGAARADPPPSPGVAAVEYPQLHSVLPPLLLLPVDVAPFFSPLGATVPWPCSPLPYSRVGSLHRSPGVSLDRRLPMAPPAPSTSAAAPHGTQAYVSAVVQPRHRSRCVLL
jgi:hypothetical protein